MATIVAVPSIGWPELLLILAALLLLFGARKLPDIARSLGKSTKEFKAGMREGAIEDPDGLEATSRVDGGGSERTLTPD